METRGFKLDFMLEKNCKANKIKMELNQSLQLLLDQFKSLVDNMKKVDSQLSKEKDIRKNIETRSKNVIEMIKSLSYTHIENTFHDNKLEKTLEEIYFQINRIQNEYSSATKLHEELTNHSVRLKENFNKFKSESDLVLLTEIDKTSFYLGQGIYDIQNDITIKNGMGVYKDYSENIYYGSFKNEYFVEGIFSKKQKDGSFSYYEGKFNEMENSIKANFEGILIPSISDQTIQKLIFFNGHIHFHSETYMGTFIFQNENKKIEIYQGNMINGLKDGKNTVLISYIKNNQDLKNNNMVSINLVNYSKGKPIISSLHYRPKKHLIENDYEDNNNHKAFYLKNDGKIPYIYTGHINKGKEDITYTLTSSNGKLIISNGDFYFGDIKRGIKEGEGIFYHMNSSSQLMISEGSYLNDELKSGKIFYGSNLIYEGKFENKSMSSGKFYYINDENNFYYEGNFKKGLRNGNGVNAYVDGSQYEGDWRNNQRHGHGSYLYQDKVTKYVGDWNNNVKDGKGLLENEVMKFNTQWEENSLKRLS